MLAKTILIIALIGRRLSIAPTGAAVTAPGMQVQSFVQAEHRGLPWVGAST